MAKSTSAPNVAEYAEVETGRNHLRNRPHIFCAVAHASRSRALLAIARIDRLPCSVLVTSQLLESGVEFVACDNPNANRLTIKILAAMAEHEGRLIPERTKAGLSTARERGIVLGSNDLTPEARRLGKIAAIKPIDPIDIVMPASLHRFPKAINVHCDP